MVPPALLLAGGAISGEIEAGLLERGVIPRPMGGYGLPDCLRITVGTPPAFLKMPASVP